MHCHEQTVLLPFLLGSEEFPPPWMCALDIAKFQWLNVIIQKKLSWHLGYALHLLLFSA